MINTIKHKLGKLYKRIGKLTYKDDNIYLIYTMGKVGSSSIYQSLKKEIPFADIYHIHHLSDHWLHEILPKGHKKFLPNIAIGEDVLRFIERNPNKRFKVITLTREPIIRSISDLFQNWESVYENINEVKAEELKSHIESLDYDYATNWFNSEFFRFLNIDIYKLPFDKNKGYEIYEFENADVCCIKLEKLNEVGPKVLKEFLGMNLNLFTANKSTDKGGKNKYLYLKENVKIDDSVLDKLYSSKYMQHFYSEEEIGEFKRKWGHNK